MSLLGSADNPTTLASYWPNARNGDTVIIKNGVYAGDNYMIITPAGWSGTIRAETDGGVLIDGEGARVPVTIDSNNVTLQGINACRSSSSVFNVTGSGNVVQRCVGWDAGDNDNNHIFNVSTGSNNLIEECAGFGIARKIFSITSGANYVTVRRCFGIWEGLTGINGPTLTFTLGYKTYYCTIDNCLAMWNRHRIVTVPDQPFGLFATDNYVGVNDDSHNSIIDSVGLVRAGDAFDANQGLLVSNIDYLSLDNVVIVIESVDPVHTGAFGLAGEPNTTGNNITLIGPQPNTNFNILPGNNHYEALSVAAAYPGVGETVWNTNNGAQLDSSVFLTWPMRQRIIDAMTTAGYAAENIIDVHAELIAIFGEA